MILIFVCAAPLSRMFSILVKCRSFVRHQLLALAFVYVALIVFHFFYLECDKNKETDAKIGNKHKSNEVGR